ncbi:hypothetical protein QUA97_11495 [Microcoleus sp. CZ3-B2]
MVCEDRSPLPEKSAIARNYQIVSTSGILYRRAIAPKMRSRRFLSNSPESCNECVDLLPLTQTHRRKTTDDTNRITPYH